MSTAVSAARARWPPPPERGHPAPTSDPVPDWREGRGAKGRPTLLGPRKASTVEGGKDL